MRIWTDLMGTAVVLLGLGLLIVPALFVSRPAGPAVRPRRPGGRRRASAASCGPRSTTAGRLTCSLPRTRPTGSERPMTITTAHPGPAVDEQPDDFSDTLHGRPYLADPEPADTTDDVPFDLGAYERSVLDSLDRLLAAAIDRSGSATRHAVRVREDLNITRRVVEAINAAMQAEDRTLATATTAVHSGEPLL